MALLFQVIRNEYGAGDKMERRMVAISDDKQKVEDEAQRLRDLRVGQELEDVHYSVKPLNVRFL